jgi:HAD superfamily hydrolase (TIGR01490 family)
VVPFTHRARVRQPEPAPASESGAAAFFDLDNTLMQGASIYWFARGLAARKYISAGDIVRFGVRQLRFRLLAAEHSGDMHATRQSALAFVEGWQVTEMRRLAEEIYDESIAERIWPGTLALAQRHLDAGQQVWLVTAAPVELGEVIASRLGLTGAIGTVAEVADGIYTGALQGDLMHGPAKARAVSALATAEDLDVATCTAYSDSINDLPMLSAVGRAVTVNPDAALRREARRRGWEIRDFRTARKAARVGVPVALATGAVAGGVVTAIALRRRRSPRDLPPRSVRERSWAAFQQPVQGVLNSLPHLVGEVVHR